VKKIFLLLVFISVQLSANPVSSNVPKPTFKPTVSPNVNNNFGRCGDGYTFESGGTCGNCKNTGCKLIASGCCHKNGSCSKSSEKPNTPPVVMARAYDNHENEKFCTVILALKKYKLSGALEDIYSDLISECSK